MMSGEVCPACGQKQKRKRGEGAGYALKQKRLYKKAVQIISWWLANTLLRDRPLTKDNIKNGFHRVGRQALGARISELLAWQIVNLVDEKRGAYRLNIERALKVVNACGNLNVLREGMTA